MRLHVYSGIPMEHEVLISLTASCSKQYGNGRHIDTMEHGDFELYERIRLPYYLNRTS